MRHILSRVSLPAVRHIARTLIDRIRRDGTRTSSLQAVVQSRLFRVPILARYAARPRAKTAVCGFRAAPTQCRFVMIFARALRATIGLARSDHARPTYNDLSARALRFDQMIPSIGINAGVLDDRKLSVFFTDHFTRHCLSASHRCHKITPRNGLFLRPQAPVRCHLKADGHISLADRLLRPESKQTSDVEAREQEPPARQKE